MDPMYSDDITPIPSSKPSKSRHPMPPPETKRKPVDAQVAVVNLLRSMGWVREPHDFDADRHPRPLLVRGGSRCVVGKTWCTFWTLEAPQAISQPRSARTDDLTQVRKESLLHGGYQPQ